MSRVEKSETTPKGPKGQREREKEGERERERERERESFLRNNGHTGMRDRE